MCPVHAAPENHVEIPDKLADVTVAPVELNLFKPRNILLNSDVFRFFTVVTSLFVESTSGVVESDRPFICHVYDWGVHFFHNVVKTFRSAFTPLMSFRLLSDVIR